MNLEDWLLLGNQELPVICDLDGTLIRQDSLKILRQICDDKGLASIRESKRALGKALEKKYVWDMANFPVGKFVFDEQICSALRQSRRILWLVTGSTDSLAQSVAAHLGFFSAARGSSTTVNLTGADKASFLVREFGANRFDYIGDSKADLEVWKAANGGAYISRKGLPLIETPQNVQTISASEMA